VQILRSQFAIDSAAQLYLGFFGRAPDTAGLAFWSSEIDKGATPVEIALGFADSKEFATMYGPLTASQKIDLAYRNILERSPDSGGAEYWTSQLEGGTPIGEIVWKLVNSAFTQTDSSDAILIQTKVAAARTITAPVILDSAVSEWSVKTGFGQIDLGAALAATLGNPITEGMQFETSIDQWATPVIGFQDSWTAGFTGKGVVIASIDSGLDLKNDALTQNLSKWNWNFVGNNDNVQDDNGHGTAIASQMIARPLDAKKPGLIGGAYDAELMVLKVVDAGGNGTQANLIAAINHAVKHGADVINISLGGGGVDSNMLKALNHAADNGVIVTLAAGNVGANMPQYPARYAQLTSNAIVVGSSSQNADGSVSLLTTTNAAGATAPYNYVLAPGSKIKAYGLNDVIQSWSGTSFAAPFVTAAVANLLSANTGLGANQIVDALVNTSVQLVASNTSVNTLAFELV
jgi:subtilisin family serine protease